MMEGNGSVNLRVFSDNSKCSRKSDVLHLEALKQEDIEESDNEAMGDSVTSPDPIESKSPSPLKLQLTKMTQPKKPKESKVSKEPANMIIKYKIKSPSRNRIKKKKANDFKKVLAQSRSQRAHKAKTPRKQR